MEIEIGDICRLRNEFQIYVCKVFSISPHYIGVEFITRVPRIVGRKKSRKQLFWKEDFSKNPREKESGGIRWIINVEAKER